jgi:hypothetical protein
MIYFTLETNRTANRIKIGYSKSPEERIKSLQTSSPVDLDVLLIMPGSKNLEHVLHKTFKKDRLRGEWFVYSDDIKDFVTRERKEGAHAKTSGAWNGKDDHPPLTRKAVFLGGTIPSLNQEMRLIRGEKCASILHSPEDQQSASANDKIDKPRLVRAVSNGEQLSFFE